MTTIQKALIAQFFPAIDITLIAEVIDATPNAEIATEILCGLYETPTIPAKVYSDDKSKLYYFESFNKWTGNVSYWYMTRKRMSGYFPMTVKASEITEENFSEKRVASNGDKTHYHEIYSLAECEKSTSSMELSRWMKLHGKFPYADEIVEITGEIKSGPPKRVFDTVQTVKG